MPESPPTPPDAARATVKVLALALLGSILHALPLDAASPDEARVQTRDGQGFTVPAQLGTNGITLLPEGAAPFLLPFTNLDYLIWTRRPTATGVPHQGSGMGLLGAYYRGTNFIEPPILRLDPAVDFTWNSQQAPLPGLDRDNFSVRWTGWIEAPRSGLYTIFFGTDDGGRLWVDTHGPASRWQRQEYAESQLTLNMIAGQKYTLRAEYFQTLGDASARLWWSGDQIPKSIIPTEWLHPAGPAPSNVVQITAREGLLATYYADPDFQGSSYTHVEPGIHAGWHLDLPPTMPALRDTWLTQHEAWLAEIRALERFRIENRLAMDPAGGPVDDHDLRQAFQARLARAEDELRQSRLQRQQRRAELFKAQAALRNLMTEDRVTPEATAALEAARQADQQAETAMQAALEQVNALRAVLAQENRRENAIADALRRSRQALDQYRLSSLALNNPVVPGIPRNLFSVRWSGLLTPPAAGTHTFHVQTDEGLRLWLEEELVIDDWHQTNLTEHTLSRELQAGRPVPIRIETRNTDATGVAVMEWSSDTMPRGPLPLASLAPCPAPAVGPAPRPFISPDVPAGLVLRNGTVLAGSIRDADRARARLNGMLERWPVPTSNLSRLHFRPLTRDHVTRLARAEPGALLVNGDYVDGDLVALKDGTLTLSSVLFGLRRFKVDDQVQAVVLRPSDAPLPELVVRTIDGSSIYTDQLATTPDALQVPAVAGLNLSGQDLWQIQWLRPSAPPP